MEGYYSYFHSLASLLIYLLQLQLANWLKVLMQVLVAEPGIPTSLHHAESLTIPHMPNAWGRSRNRNRSPPNVIRVHTRGANHRNELEYVLTCDLSWRFS
ncbi:hypothetical protein I3843_Q027900 [Carya illinoinensis]|nr:hypothetical protein I3843_Q027900 [Carya illinoinensis]